MVIVATIFVCIVMFFGLLNSYRKYENGQLPLNFFYGHVLLAILVLSLALYVLYV